MGTRISGCGVRSRENALGTGGRDARGEDITLQTPEFGLPDAQGQRWVARSGVAVVNGDQTEVRLRDGVTIDSAPGATPTRFSTDHLTILPEQDRADTPATVTLQIPAYSALLLARP